MKYILSFVGNIKNDFKGLFDEYSKRIDLEIHTFKKREQLNKFLENKRFILVTEKGDEFNSLNFADFIKNNNELIFVIGDDEGFDDILWKNAWKKVSLSKMTFPHDLAKIILVEQLYRVESILKGKCYHK